MFANFRENYKLVLVPIGSSKSIRELYQGSAITDPLIHNIRSRELVSKLTPHQLTLAFIYPNSFQYGEINTITGEFKETSIIN